LLLILFAEFIVAVRLCDGELFYGLNVFAVFLSIVFAVFLLRALIYVGGCYACLYFPLVFNSF